MPLQSVYLNGGYIGVTKTYKVTTEIPLTDFTFVASATGVNSPNVVIPASAQAGDIAIIVDNEDTAGTLAAPSGWTLIRSDSVSSNITGTTYYRILQSGDAGTTVTSTDGTTTNHFMLCAVFRPNAGTVTGITINDLDGEATTGNPSQQTLSMSAETGRPIIGFFAMGQRGSNNIALNVTDVPDGFSLVFCQDESSRDVIELYYIIYADGDTPANVTGDIGDNGAQFMQSFYFTFTSTPDTSTSYTSGIWNLQSVTESLST